MAAVVVQPHNAILRRLDESRPGRTGGRAIAIQFGAPHVLAHHFYVERSTNQHHGAIQDEGSSARGANLKAMVKDLKKMNIDRCQYNAAEIAIPSN